MNCSTTVETTAETAGTNYRMLFHNFLEEDEEKDIRFCIDSEHVINSNKENSEERVDKGILETLFEEFSPLEPGKGKLRTCFIFYACVGTEWEMC
ncbi:hypothetical protein AVEN_104519-1 [Araneus ventricosus]|uniref:Uncharacterized protein n=1 Tax=Araneus ventricosus TaxID=182803 RepID=A0A4Y2M6T5_ARAVE|nr:hypothetical protein AVEN_104519-1 [Araneus ventricosus]